MTKTLLDVTTDELEQICSSLTAERDKANSAYNSLSASMLIVDALTAKGRRDRLTNLRNKISEGKRGLTKPEIEELDTILGYYPKTRKVD